MKIAIDTFGCENGRSGFGSYVLNFISNLPSLENKKIEFELFGNEEDRYTYTSGKEISYQSVKILSNLKHLRIWHIFHMRSFAKKNKYDVVLFPAAHKVLPSSFSGYKGVVILNSILSSDIKGQSWIYRHQLKKGLRHAYKIIAASEYIKKDLIKLGARKEKITVIHNGIDHKLFYPVLHLADDIIDIKPFAIKRPYFVYSSTLSGPEKKHIELIHAFELFKKNTGFPHRLVITGNEGLYSDKIHKVAFDSAYASDIFLTGFFPHESVAKLFAGAEACVFPSVNEGVGLPILEAMASGIPVLCSDKGALKEIGGTAPLYFDSDNIDQIASCMRQIVEDKDLREKMIFDGTVWSAEFNWEKTVMKTISLFQA